MLSFILQIIILTGASTSLPQSGAGFQLENARLAKSADDAKFANSVGDTCTGDQVICVGSALGQCVNGRIVSLGNCGGATQCQVLPLVNRPGTSTTCSTEEDKQRRFVAAGLNESRTPDAPEGGGDGNDNNSQTSNNQVATTQFKANDNVCIDDTSFRKFTSATDFEIQQCAPGLCFTRSPPVKNPCIGRERAIAIDS